MGINSSLTTALTGLATSQQQIDVVGNNIANVNTIGYKSTSIDFKTQFLQNFSYGTAPTSTDGGTNPLQIGLGVQSGAISTNFTDGAVQTTGIDTNMAIQGDGFFVLKDGTNQVYTRDGTFQLNNQHQLISSTGQLVQGYGADANGTIIPGVLTNITIPLGTGSIAEATSNVDFDQSNLNASGALPTSVSQINSQPLYLSDGAGGVAATPPTNATLLTDVTDASGNAQFQVGDVISFTGTVGTTTAPAKTLTVTASTKLSDLESFTSGTLGIDTAAGANGAVTTTPGSALTAAPDPTVIPQTVPPTTLTNAAQLTISGNPGTLNNISLTSNSLTIDRSGTTTSPMTWTTVSSATGESINTSFTAYDSLGNSVNVGVTAVLASKSSNGSVWQFYANSPSGSATDAATNNLVGAGTLTFDSTGNLIGTTGSTVTIDRANTGANPTLSFNLDFTGTKSLSEPSALAESSSDGAAPGYLVSFTIGNDGIITGSYTNDLTRNVGQVALATFQNDQGLVNDGGNTFSTGPNSGTAVITTPGNLSAGKIVQSSLEGSNVDLSTEFVNLISASTAFSASSRVITTSEQLLQALLQAAQG
jgi:flagellar hook protein FlgE